MAQCSRCAKKLADGARFCTSCGQPVGLRLAETATCPFCLRTVPHREVYFGDAMRDGSKRPICLACVVAAIDLIGAEPSISPGHVGCGFEGVTCRFCWRRFPLATKLIVTKAIDLDFPERRNVAVCVGCARRAADHFGPSIGESAPSRCIALLPAIQ